MNIEDFKGSWAIVTGASAGIGREFAEQLARHKINMVLVARRGVLLDAIGVALRQTHGVEVHSLALDLADNGSADTLTEFLGAHSIAPKLLVNNAGVGHWGRFEKADAQAYRRLVSVNATATLQTCVALFPVLARQAPSAIINVSSQAAFQPMPFMAAYSASKAFVHHLSLALYEEWREHGIYVQTLVPGPTATEFDALAGAYPTQLTAERDPPSKTVTASLLAFESEEPLVISASGTVVQQLFAALAPTRMVLDKVGQMFRPPT